jgi:hypothetical protein
MFIIFQKRFVWSRSSEDVSVTALRGRNKEKERELKSSLELSESDDRTSVHSVSP